MVLCGMGDHPLPVPPLYCLKTRQGLRVIMGLEVVKCKLCDLRLDAEDMMRHIREHGYRYTTLEDWIE